MLLAAAGSQPAGAQAPARAGTLAIGVNIAGIGTLDPGRQAGYATPLVLAAAYDTLVTYIPGATTSPVPSLATGWEPLSDGPGWRFTLRPGVRFGSGRLATAEDWVFSLNRAVALGGPNAGFLAGLAGVDASAPGTLDLRLTSPEAPILGVLAAPAFALLDREETEAHGGTDRPGADFSDRATGWLNDRSAGTGPYTLTGWTRNQRIDLAANPQSWRGPAPFRRLTILHMPNGTAQLQAMRRGDIDAAFNLLPEQIVALQSRADIRVESVTSLDFIYLALNGDPAVSKPLAIEQARQAIGYAIDYDGLIGRLLGGKAVRPAHFLPLGISGSTEAVARTVGFHQDLGRSRRLLAEAGLPDGFGFELSFSDGAIAGLPYPALAQKIRTDLAQVGIRATLQAQEPGRLRDRYLAGQAQATLAFWNSPVVEPAVWAAAALERVGPRVGAPPPPALLRLIGQAAAEPDAARQQALWTQLQAGLVEAAHLIVLFQPIYQVAVRNTVKPLLLTAAGWLAELRTAAPS